MKVKHSKVQIAEEFAIIILLALVIILAVELKKTKTAMNELVANLPAVEQEAENEPEIVEKSEDDLTKVPQVKPENTEDEKTSDNVTANDNETMSGNSVINWIENYPQTTIQMPLEERVKLYSSYDDTMAQNARDKEIIANTKVDFSEVKIACLGDSLTAASNLGDDKYSYPTLLKEILGAKEVYNLGIGGSTIIRGDVGANPMVERFGRIPKDTDIIIVFGSTNDSLFENKWEFGHIEYDKRMTKGTFCGDLDEMLGGIMYSYVAHGEKVVKLLIVAPPATVLNTEGVAEDPGMIPQSKFIEAIYAIAPAYKFEIIDMYHTNFLNSHDERIKKEFIADGVHPNEAGYRIIAEHLASQIIQRCEQ